MNTSIESSIPVGGKLAKVAAAVNDTLKVTAASYAKRTIPVTSYDQELDITLYNEGAVVVQLDQTRQVIDGWGINNNWKTLGNSGISACFGMDQHMERHIGLLFGTVGQEQFRPAEVRLFSGEDKPMQMRCG
ncbi:MAG: hypothetical protein JW913_03585 [Chitinispirillaceae bacterium]|nr:hypothetical protein [Chitinispirillaceae bacterium]